MKILLAPDKFKGSLSAFEVCAALKKGLLSTGESHEIITKPLADGGDGSLVILREYFTLEEVKLTVHDPLMRPVTAAYLLADKTAYIELASAAGYALLKQEERNPMYTTTYGTGEMIADALQRGVTEIYLFIGGSATNDGATGIATALGYRFIDASGQVLKPTGENLSKIETIDDRKVIFDPEEVQIKVVCDVNNPFFGPQGAAHIYAKQKGASPAEIEILDAGLKILAAKAEAQDYPQVGSLPGAGAAGGTGGGCVAFLGGKLISGIDTFLEITKLEETLKNCDLVITGEGKIDAQTESGKVVSGVAGLANKYGIPAIGVSGAADAGAAEKLGLQKIYTVAERSKTLEEAMTQAAEKTEEIGKEISRVLSQFCPEYSG